MINKIQYTISILILILFMFLIGVYGYMSIGDKEENYKVSVILESNNSERFSVLEKGMESAAKEYNTEINIIMVSPEMKVTERMDIIKRELQNGAHGLILNMSNEEDLVKEIDELLLDTPVVIIESEVTITKGHSYIAPNNYQLGYDLGSYLLQHKKAGTSIGIVAGVKRKYSNMERKNGLVSAVGEKNIYWIIEEEKEIKEGVIKRKLKDYPVDYVVGLNSIVTEEILDVAKESQRDEWVFGVGNTEKIVYYVDKGVIGGLVAPNEYLMGYMSVKNMYNRLNYNTEEQNIEIGYLLINKKNLYNMENQKLLFPMVQ